MKGVYDPVVYFVVILAVLLILLVVYIISLQSQVRRMANQLDKRLLEHTHQPVSLELINADLNKLAISINKSLKAEESLRLKGLQEEKRFREMVADISHDLRTPLTAIKGYQQLLEKEALSEEQRRKLFVAVKHTEELGILIEHFFEYSYLLNTEPGINKERLNLTNLVTDCLIASVNLLEKNKLAVDFMESSPIFLLTDREMVTRMVQNLIRNAVQHSAGDIKVELKEEKNTVFLSFQNPVRKPDNLDVNRIFERFYTGDNTRSHSSGLGLSIVKLLAEQLGGSAAAFKKDEILEIRITLNKTQ